MSKGALLLLEPGNKLLAKTVEDRLNWEYDPPRFCDQEVYDVKLNDFDNCSYEIKVLPGTTAMLVVTHLPCFRDIAEHGGTAALARQYGESYDEKAQDLGDIVLSFELANRKDMDENKKAQLITDISLVKAVAIGGVFAQYFQGLLDGKKQDPYKFNVRHDTEVFVCPGSDRVTIVFALDFLDQVDKVIAKMCLQEFPEQQRKKVARAPPCNFGINPPRELEDGHGIKENTGCLGYISFSVQKSHIDSQKKLDTVCQSLVGFRTYLQYHIKCAKSFFHSRMRLRAKELLKVLNRAKLETLDDKNKQKKDVHGKTFVRK